MASETETGSVLGKDDCIICCEPWSERTLRTVTCCNHDGVCSLCFLKIRSLSRDMQCPMCKTDLDHVICLSASEEEPKTWDGYSIWGDSIGPDHTLDPRSK